MPVGERFVDHHGVRIRYLDNGQATGRDLLPVVFVPGLTDCAEDYLQMFELFEDRRLLVIEMRGRGGSDSPEKGYSAADHAADLESVVAAEDLPRFHLMTFSRGTTASLDLALSDGARVATLAVGDYRLTEVALPASFVDQMWNSRWRGRLVSERVSRKVLEGIQAESRDRPLWADVAALGIPVLVARGDQGGIVSDEVAETFRQRIPGVEIAVMPGSGHDLFRPDRLAYPRAALEFIARRGPGT